MRRPNAQKRREVIAERAIEHAWKAAVPHNPRMRQALKDIVCERASMLDAGDDGRLETLSRETLFETLSRETLIRIAAEAVAAIESMPETKGTSSGNHNE